MGTFGRILRNAGNSAQEESRPESSRAEGLIAEFESSEKGWFWETTREGMLSYVSDSVARALGREPADLLGRPFTDLTSTGSRRSTIRLAIRPATPCCGWWRCG